MILEVLAAKDLLGSKSIDFRASGKVVDSDIPITTTGRTRVKRSDGNVEV